MKLLALALVITALVGCASRSQSKGLRYLIAPQNLTAPVELINCDQSSPPKCKSVKVHYKKGTEQIQVSQ